MIAYVLVRDIRVGTQEQRVTEAPKDMNMTGHAAAREYNQVVPFSN